MDSTKKVTYCEDDSKEFGEHYFHSFVSEMSGPRNRGAYVRMDPGCLVEIQERWVGHRWVDFKPEKLRAEVMLDCSYIQQSKLIKEKDL